MKIVQENSSSTPRALSARGGNGANRADDANEKNRPGRVHWGSWYIQILFALFVFAFGAAVYRSGALTPVTSFLKNLVVPGPLITKMPQPMREAAASVSDEMRLYENNGLPTLYIDLPFANYQKLLDKRDEALKIGILNTSDADFVSGEIHLQGEPAMKADLRLKGDWVDHLMGDKWSFRIKIKDGGQVLGMGQFNIQTPAARNFLNEWAFHQHLIQEGVLTTRYQFVNVLLNGKLLGIYAIEDHFTAEMIESQGRRQGLLLRFNEDPMWKNLSAFMANQINQESSLSVANEWTASIDAFQDTKLAEDPVLSAEAETARDLLRAFQSGDKAPSEVFDVDLCGRFFALHDLWQATHGVAWHNVRFYYNPVTGLLEPVAYDAEPFFRHPNLITISSEFIKIRIFNDPQIRTAYAKELYRVTDPEYVQQTIASLKEEHDRLLKALSVEYPLDVPIPDSSLSVDWGLLEERARSLHVELLPGTLVRGSYQALNVLPGSDGAPTLTLDLVNLMLMPVEVLRVVVNGQAIEVDPQTAVLPPVMDPQEQKVGSTQISVPLAGNEGFAAEAPPKVEVVARIKGLNEEYTAELSGIKLPDGIQAGPTPAQPTLEQALERYPFLESDPQGSNRLIIPAGVWNVEGDLVLPDQMDVYVLRGAVLRFSAGSIFYTTGGVFLMGTAAEPVILTAQEDTWGGMVVLKSAQTSEWQYASVEKTAGISRDGWVLTGGITFFQSNIFLDHTFIGNNQTEDAINVIHGVFQFRNCEFANTFADALDSDFSNGEVTGCFFHDITGDAVDVSGTTAVVSETRMERVTDKGVSVGEKSDIRVVNTRMDTVGIGVASKDLSTALVSNTRIDGARFAALAAYIKKPVYGPASIEAQQVTILNTQQAAVAQTGSRILIDGKEIETVELDVDRLYRENILGN